MALTAPSLSPCGVAAQLSDMRQKGDRDIEKEGERGRE
jgi:hypothetical protein